MQDIQLNTWYQGEGVAPSDMLLVNQAFIQTMFAANGGTPQIIGGAITVSGNNFNIAKGFAYYGESTDATYIARTGTNQLCSVILPQGSLPLVNVNCYIYVNYVITYTPTNRSAIITANVYSSVNPNDAGIKICQIINSVPTNYTNNNITNYFRLGSNNTLVATDPSGNSFSLAVDNLQASGNISSQGTGNFGGANNHDANSFITNSATHPGYIAKVFTSEDPVLELQSGTLVTNGTVSGSNLSKLDTSLGSDFVRVSNYSKADVNSYVNAGVATYVNQGALLYPVFSNEASLPNNHTVIVSSLADSQGAGGLELLCDNAINQAGVIVNYDHANFLWSRPILAGDLSLQTRTDPKSITVTGDFRNKLLFIDPPQRYFLLINAYHGSSNLWYCTLSGFVKVHALTAPNDATYELELLLYGYFGIMGAEPSTSGINSIGTVNRVLYAPLIESPAEGNYIYIGSQSNILVGLQFDRNQPSQSMEASFVCQFTCTTIGNF